eukprot:3304354-Alexandrium_andersonii.AAC.1
MSGPLNHDGGSYSPAVPSNFFKSLPETPMKVAMHCEIPSKDWATAARMGAGDVPALHPGTARARG